MARLTLERTEAYVRDGFVLERSILTPSEVEGINDAFVRLHASGGVPGRYEPPPPEQDYDDGVHYLFERGDPLARFPRAMKPHLFMPEIRAVALDSRLFDTVEDRCGRAAARAHAEGGGPCGTPHELAP